MSVVVIGTGGHARVCVDVLHAGGVEVAGWVGGPPTGGSEVPYLGGDECLAELVTRVTGAFVAIGDNRTRRRLADDVVALGYTLVNAVHPTATVAPSVRLGTNVLLVAGSVVNAFARIDDGVIINTGASVDHDCHVRAFAHIAPGARLAGTVDVGEGAFLGIGSAVIPGRRIGDWATVGAGAAVVRDVEPGATVVGVPARPVRRSQP